MGELVAEEHDITRYAVDAIVNAANLRVYRAALAA